MKKLIYFSLLLGSFAALAQLSRQPAARSRIANANWPPTVTITSPLTGSEFLQGDNITFTATATGQSGTVTNLTWVIDGITHETQTAPFLFVLTNALAGDHVALAFALDDRGSVGGPAVRFFTVSAAANIAPTVTLTAPATGAKATVGSPITLSATAADIDGTISFVEFWAGSLLITNDATAPYSFAWIGPPGTNFPITAVSQDNQGYRATSSPPVLISFTNYVPPGVTILTPTVNQSFTNVTNITFTASTVNGSGTVTNVSYSIGVRFQKSASAPPWTVIWTNVTVGSWNAVAVATDDLGMFSSSPFLPFKVFAPANVLPTVTLTSPPTGTKTLVGNALTVTGTATDSDGTISQVELWSGSLLIATDTIFPYSFSWIGPPGTNFSLTLVAEDNHGSRTTSSPPVLVSFTNSPPVITNQPPTVSITSPTNGSSFVFPAPFTLGFNVADSDGTVSSLQVLTNGVLSQTLFAAPWQVNYSALPVGTWTFTGRVFDNLGSNTLSSPITITVAAPPNVPPAVSITSPNNGSSFIAPASFTVIVSATDSDGSIARVDLLVNNVVTTNLTTAPYAFNITGLGAGTWQYKARAYDNLGTNITSTPITVTVSAPPPPPPPPPTTFTAIGGNGSVTLNWLSVVGATRYALFRGVVPGSFFALTNIVGLTFVDTAVTNGTTYYYQVASVNPQGTGTPSTTISATPLGPPQATSITRGSTWKYYDQDTDLGTIWRGVAFNDSAWLSGPAILGYGDPDISTLISYGRSTALRNTTTYLRDTINIVDKTIYTDLIFNCIVDDGVVVFLNGTEVFRFNVAAGQNYHTLATIAIDPPQNRTWIGTNVSTSLLVNGLNTVSVELHSKWNSATDTDADLAFDAELINSSTPPPQPPIAPSNLQATAGSSGTIPGGQAVGTEYFASPTGNAGNTGLTVASPWTLAKALTDAGSGNTITLLNGTYPSIVINTHRLLVRSQNRLGAKVVGSAAQHGIASGVGITNVTLDGIEVDHSYIDGIKLRGDNSVVRNCWIHWSGFGDPMTVTNNDQSFTGQGIASHGPNNVIIEYNLIEDNGPWVNNDHGFYGDGTNGIIRGNIFRRNAAYSVILYDEDGPRDNVNWKVYNNLMISSANHPRPALGAVTYHAQTNYFFNNTIIHPTYYAVNAGVVGNGIMTLTNNIIIGTGGAIDNSYGVYREDYNLSTAALNVPGTHNVTVNPVGFVNQNNYLYWLTAASAARGAALSSTIPFDFFKNANKPVTDIGAFQFDSVLATDVRNLSGNLGTNFWDQSFTINGSQDTIFLTWQDNSNNETGFDIDESLNGSSFNFKSSVGANITSYSVTGLTNCSTRYYRVRARNGSLVSAYSGTASATTTCPPPQTLPAPTGLAAQGGNATVAVKWNPVSGATGYALTRAIALGGPYYALSSPSVTNYTDNAVTNGVTYFYTVATVNGAGTGAASSAASATPQNTATPPAAPTALVATAGSAGVINLTWANPATDETGTEVWRSSDNISFTLINTTGANATSFSDTGLPSNTLRYYRVRNRNGSGNSAYSNTANATTINVVNPPGFYVDVNGTAGGSGDQAHPWTLAYALTGPSALMNAANRTVNINGGTYVPANGSFSCSIQASAGNPVIFRAVNSVHSASRAIIDGATNDQGAPSIFKSNGMRFVILENVVIRNSAARQDMSCTNPCWSNRPSGYQDDSGQGNKVRGCIIYDTGTGISVQNNSSQTGFESNGNILLYTGWDLSSGHEGPRGYAQSWYLQNRGPDSIGAQTTPDNGLALLQDNISGFSFNQGHSLQGSFNGGSRANNHKMIGDVHFMAGFVAQHNLLPNGDRNGRNMLIGTEVASTNIEVSECVMFYRPNDGLSSFTVGYNGSGYDDRISANGVFKNNYIVGQAFAKQWNGITYTGNTIVNNYQYGSVQAIRDINYTTHGTWNNNTYYSTLPNSPGAFNRNGSQISFGAWKSATGFDAQSTYVNANPTTTFTRLRVLSYDPNGANLTIINWPLAPTVSVPMTGFLSTSNNYAVYSASAPFILHQSGTYNGTQIDFDCRAAAQNIMPPATGPGVLVPDKTAPLFNCFRIRKL